ncbi:MAG: DUF2911 domain-containing protein [Bacteroidota bacterium]
MKNKCLHVICLVLISLTSFAQIPLTVATSGGNKKAAIKERMGLTDVTINYDRPAVKGREGKIWGQLVPVGFTDPGFGSSKSSPWRAGANENTTMLFSTDVTINGQPLKAGKYGFFIAYDPAECTLIFSNNSTSWGHFFYNANEDALRIKVKPVALDKSVEWLKYEFIDQTDNGGTVALEWEKLMIPFKIETDFIKEQIASFRRELRTEKGFLWESWDQAAAWSLQNNTNLDEALLWTDSSTSRSFGGDRSFIAWSTRAQLLEKIGRTKEAEELMKDKLSLASVFEIHQYGRRLVQLKKEKEALEVFKMNYEKYPKEFTPLVGLARGYSAVGDYKNALKFANKALLMAPDEINKTSLKTMLEKLKDNKDVN